MKSKTIAVWLGIAAIVVFGTAMASSARAQAQRKEEASTVKVWGYYRIVGTQRGGDGKVLVEVIVRLINRSGENYSLNSMRMLGPWGGFHIGKAVEGTATGLTIGVTTVKEQFAVSVENADKLREATRLALVLSMGDGEQARKTIMALLQRDPELREEN